MLYRVNFEVLEFLLKASSKKQVVDICKDAYRPSRNTGATNADNFRSVATGLGISLSESQQLMASLNILIKSAVFNNCISIESISALFPENFHGNLRQLLSKIIVDGLPEWRNEAVANSVSLPRLLDFDWKVAVKMDETTRANTASCVLHLQVEEALEKRDGEPRRCTKSVEMSKETLETILHGLGRIRDSLSVVANK